MSASPLFNGDAGSGPSNIRRWLFEKDFIDCIVKLPDSIFFRTGINTYLWILSNNKPEERKGLIQLIDASEMKTSLRKNLGNKRYEISQEDRDWIVKTYIDGHDHGKSVIVPYTDFMYRKVTTQQPLHAALHFDNKKLDEFFSQKPIAKLSDDNKEILRQEIVAEMIEAMDNTVPYERAEEIAKKTRKLMTKPESTVTAIAKSILDTYMVKSKEFPKIIDSKGNIVYDVDLKDSENIPWGMDFGEYMEKEVLHFAPETVIDETVTDVGPLQDYKVGVVGTNISSLLKVV